MSRKCVGEGAIGAVATAMSANESVSDVQGYGCGFFVNVASFSTPGER
jgi:hypothetical protein